MGSLILNTESEVFPSLVGDKVHAAYSFYIGQSIDPSAQLFLNATGITNPTQKTALNNLVDGLKGYSLWNKMKFFFPFMGGTSNTNKYNLIDARDLNSAFRLVFSGGVTHTANGVTFNGINGFAETFLVPNSVFSSPNIHMSVYSRSSTAAAQRASGVYNDPTRSLTLFIRRSLGVPLDGFVSTNTDDSVFSNFSSTDSRGFFVTSRTSPTSLKGYKNGVLLDTKTTLSTNNLPITSIQIARVNGVGLFDNKNYASFSVGDGLNDIEVSNLYSVVQSFQTALGRNV